MPPPTQPPAAPERRGRRRGAALVAACGVVAVGLLARFGLPGLLGDVVGGVLYAVLVYLLVVAVCPLAGRRRVAFVALAITLGVELAQLTRVPAELAEAFWPVRLVLGSGFVWTDLVSGAVGVGLAAVVDRWRR